MNQIKKTITDADRDIKDRKKAEKKHKINLKNIDDNK